MKVLLHNDQSLHISTETYWWGKLACFGISVLLLLLPILTEANFFGYIFFFLGAMLAALVTTSIAKTFFDLRNDRLYYSYSIAGILVRKFDHHMSEVKLRSSIGEHGIPYIYLCLPSGKNFRIGEFWSIGQHDEFVASVLNNIPIDHRGDF
tara:strand:+ start:72 stop:524 length:453 start_codon:yes stop_codon:yes gene_type:complete